MTGLFGHTNNMPATAGLHTACLQGVTGLFGHTKNEMEGNNITMLMPQPFCQRHASYLQRYTSTMSPHILDRLREVVALHKVGG